MRLINAGKPSNVFATADYDDEHEDDYVESRELFAKWDGQRIAEEQRTKDECDKDVQEHLKRAVEQIRAHEMERIFGEARKHLLEELAAKAQAAVHRAAQRPLIAESVRLEVQELIVADEALDCDENEQQMEAVDNLEEDADVLDDSNSYEIIEIAEESDVKNENVDNVEIDQADDNNEILSNDGNEEEFIVDEAKSGKSYFTIIVSSFLIIFIQ